MRRMSGKRPSCSFQEDMRTGFCLTANGGMTLKMIKFVLIATGVKTISSLYPRNRKIRCIIISVACLALSYGRPHFFVPEGADVNSLFDGYPTFWF